MSRMPLSEAIALARGHVEAGRLAEARAVCHAVLGAEPRAEIVRAKACAAVRSRGPTRWRRWRTL